MDYWGWGGGGKGYVGPPSQIIRGGLAPPPLPPLPTPMLNENTTPMLNEKENVGGLLEGGGGQSVCWSPLSNN